MLERDGADDRARWRSVRGWAVSALALLLLFGLASLGGGSAPMRSPSLDLVSATNPTPPSNVSATGRNTALDLTWTASAELTTSGYRIYVDDVPVLATSGTGTTATVSGLVNGRTYSVTIATLSSVLGVTHEGTTRSTPAGGTPHDGLPPTAPAGFAAVPGDRQVALSWSAPNDLEVRSHELRRDGVLIATLGASATGYTDTGLVNGTGYEYSLIAVDVAGQRSAAATTPATPRDAVAPAAPTGLAATPGDRQVTLTWTANTETDLASYRVLRNGVEVAVVGGTSYTDTGRSNGTSYSYTLVALDTSGNASPASPPVAATPRDAVAPAAPTGVTGSGGDGRAVIRWNAGIEYDLASYRVLRQDGSTAVEVAAPATEAVVTGLVNGTSYTFTVVAVDTSGNVSAGSAPVTVVPANPAAVPSEGSGQSGGLALSSSGRYLVVGTRARLEPADTNTAYELYLVDRDTGTRRRLAPLSASSTSTTDSTNNSAPAISDDGRYVVLATTQRLLPADTNSLADVYRLDTSTGTWALVSVPASGAVSASTAGTLLQPGPSVAATSPAVAVSADGDLVLFYSARADLVPGDTNGLVDVFAKRMSTGAVTRVSTSSTGGNLTRQATGPALALTPDGRFALFPAAATSGPVVLYRKTLSGAGAGAISVVSTVGSTEFAVYRDAGDVAISDDGRYVALVTAAKVDTSTPTASYSTGSAYRKDVGTGALVAMGTGQRTIWEHRVELDPSGRYGFFSTAAAALPADTNGRVDFYRRDLDGGLAGPLVLVTADSGGAPTGGPAGSVTAAEYGRASAVSGDRVLLLTSQALVPADTNGLRDVYSKDLASGSVGGVLG